MPVTVGTDLSIRFGSKSIPLTPAQGYDLAEALIRTSTRRLVAEEMGLVESRDMRPVRARDDH